MYLIWVERCAEIEVFVMSLGINQQPDPGFTGATTPQSPLMSPRMAHTQSPMIQQSQANPAYQSSTEMNGWAQGNMGGNRYVVYQE